MFNNVINGKVIDKIETIEQLVTKDHWKDSKIIAPDTCLCHKISCDLELSQADSIFVKILPRIEIPNHYELFMDKRYRNNMIMSVITENKVIIVNKLSTYYLLRKVENEWTDFMSLYTEGTDYYVSESERSSIPFHFFYFNNKSENHIKNFNLM